MAAPSMFEQNHFSPLMSTRPSPMSRAVQCTVRPRSEPPSRSVRNIDPSVPPSSVGGPQAGEQRVAHVGGRVGVDQTGDARSSCRGCTPCRCRPGRAGSSTPPSTTAGRRAAPRGLVGGEARRRSPPPTAPPWSRGWPGGGRPRSPRWPSGRSARARAGWRRRCRRCGRRARRRAPPKSRSLPSAHVEVLGRAVAPRPGPAGRGRGRTSSGRRPSRWRRSRSLSLLVALASSSSCSGGRRSRRLTRPRLGLP